MTVVLETISVKVLADLYNLLSETPVKKFADKAAGVRRLSKVLEETNHEVFESEGEYDVRPVAAPEQADPHAASNALIANAVANNPELAEIVKVPAKKAKVAGGKRGPAPDYSDDSVITVLVANPKRPNTASYDRFALYTVGITVGEFIAKGGRRADLAWDAKHAFISVDKPAK